MSEHNRARLVEQTTGPYPSIQEVEPMMGRPVHAPQQNRVAAYEGQVPNSNQGYAPNNSNQGYIPPQPATNNQSPYGQVPHNNNNNHNPYANQQHGVQPQYVNAVVVPLKGHAHPKIIVIEEAVQTACRYCGYDGPSTIRKTAGGVTFGWCICLFCLVGVVCFWIPFCVDGCKDTEVICNRCGKIKTKIEANCC